MAFLGDLFCLAPLLWCSGLTRCSEKSILEISQGNTDFDWPLENLFQGQKPHRFENFQNGYKWHNEADKQHCLIFIFYPGPPKRRKKAEVWKNRLWAQSGSGYWKTESAYQNPRKGTETFSWPRHAICVVGSRITKIPRSKLTPFRKRSLCHRGTETSFRRTSLTSSTVALLKSPDLIGLLLEKGGNAIGGLKTESCMRKADIGHLLGMSCIGFC